MSDKLYIFPCLQHKINKVKDWIILYEEVFISLFKQNT